MLRDGPVPTPRDEARARALDAALSAYDLQNTSAATQGTAKRPRLTERAWRLWSEMMNKKMYATPAIAGLLALPIAGYTTYYMMQDSPFAFDPEKKIGETTESKAGRDKSATRERTELTVAKPATVAAAEGRRPTTRASYAATSPPTCSQAGSAEDRGRGCGHVGSRAGSRRRAQYGAGRADEPRLRRVPRRAWRRGRRRRPAAASRAMDAPRVQPNRS